MSPRLIVVRERPYEAPEVPHDSIEAFRLDRPNNALRVGVAVGCSGRRADHASTDGPEHPLHRAAPLRIGVADLLDVRADLRRRVDARLEERIVARRGAASLRRGSRRSDARRLGSAELIGRHAGSRRAVAPILELTTVSVVAIWIYDVPSGRIG